ncbi:FliA/WhiG family RNA polymerase sigma factor [soil metagenome]
MVRLNLPLVGHAVRQTLSRVPAHVSGQELASAGMLALVRAARSFDPARGASFTTYASIRIRGAIIDELRGRDWASRSVRRRAREMEDACGRISATLGRPADDHEIAAALGIGTTELAAHREDIARATVVSLQGFDDGTFDDLLPALTVTPADVLEQRERVAYLHDAVAQLPKRLRVVVEGYFFRELPMADLAAELGVSESRISQLRAEAIALMRGAMNSAFEPDQAEKHERPEGCAARRKEAYYAGVAAHRTYTSRLSHARSRPIGHIAAEPAA